MFFPLHAVNVGSSFASCSNSVKIWLLIVFSPKGYLRHFPGLGLARQSQLHFFVRHNSSPFSSCNIFFSKITIFEHLSCFMLHYKSCFKDCALECSHPIYFLCCIKVSSKHWSLESFHVCEDTVLCQFLVLCIIHPSTYLFKSYFLRVGVIALLITYEIPNIVLSDSTFNPPTYLEVTSIIIPILQLRKLRHSVIWLAQVSPDTKNRARS